MNRHVEGLAASHQRLLEAIDPIDGVGITDEMVAGPSRLPGWTVGHVLTHLARNADSFVRLTLAAENDEVVEQYSGGLEARRRDIENGSTRSAREIIDDLRRSIYSLEGAWAGARRAWFEIGRAHV